MHTTSPTHAKKRRTHWEARFAFALLTTLTLSLAAGCGGGDGADGFIDETGFSVPGPFTTDSIVAANCTFFWPSNAVVADSPFPIILWGNGTSQQTATYQPLLTHLASYGFIVASANSENTGDGVQMLACLSHLTDKTSNTPPYSLIDTTRPLRVGASGHSQGGAGAIMAGRDARINATAVIQPYIGPITGGGPFVADSIKQQNGAMLLLSAANDTTAVPSYHQLPVYKEVNQPVFWATLSGSHHYEPFGDAGNYRGVITAWFLNRLSNNLNASVFFPPACSPCTIAGWTIESKGF